MKFTTKYKTPIIISPTMCKIIGKILLGETPAGALALYPFIIVRDTDILNNEEYIRHESIHLKQYTETLIIGLLLIGLIQYIYARYFLKKPKLESYYFMSHEQEAHQNDQDKNYLNNRKFLSYYKYLLPKNRKRMELVNGKRVIYE
ncbi:MAG: hypothetical protein WC795_02015 [Candidatus Paceibacterota bacterium]|jgi:hypothetical protein